MRPNAVFSMTVSEIISLIPNRTAPWLLENLAFYKGDHWQRGKGWCGPYVPVGDPNAATVMREIERAFVAKNVIAEVIDRHVDGVLSDDPTWMVVEENGAGSDQAHPQAEQIVGSLRRWWSSQQCILDYDNKPRLINARAALYRATADALLTERGELRVFVPAGFLLEGPEGEALLPSGVTLDQALSMIYLQVVNPNKQAVVVNSDTYRPIGVYAIEENGQNVVELSYLEGEETVLEVRSDRQQRTSVALGRRLFHHEITARAMVDETVRRLQRQLNLALTMMSRNVVTGGFLERVFLNAQMPGKMVMDERTGETRFEPEPFETGPGTTAFVSGIRFSDAEGNEHVANASVAYRDPVTAQTFIETRDAYYAAILEEANQAHVLANDASQISGESRRQARIDFEASLAATRSQVEAALTWLAEVVLRLAGRIAGDATLQGDWRMTAKLFPSPALLTSDESELILKMVEAGLLSKETALQRFGVREPRAELERAADERVAASAADSTSLAAALVRAREQAAGGRQSNGLEAG